MYLYQYNSGVNVKKYSEIRRYKVPQADYHYYQERPSSTLNSFTSPTHGTTFLISSTRTANNLILKEGFQNVV